MTDKKINTKGGAYIAGNVNTGGGDLVGRDKKVTVKEGGVYIGGDAKNNTIVTGDGNTVGVELQQIFAPVYQAVQQSDLPEQTKSDLQAEIEEVEGEIVKADDLNESFLARRLRSIKRMAPDIFELLVASLSGPGAVISTVGKKIAEKVKAEG